VEGYAKIREGMQVVEQEYGKEYKRGGKNTGRNARGGARILT
jgi:hypothetical protein